MSAAAAPPAAASLQTSTGAIVDPLIATDIGAFVADLYIPALLFVGLLILTVAWLPLFLRRLPLSLPIICVAIGWAVFKFTPFATFSPHPQQSPLLIEKATELIVIVSLMGAGLKIDRALSWRGWGMTARLLAIAMPLSILAAFTLGDTLLGLGVPLALLLGAALAPTDPVLASDVQIEHPDKDHPDEARFTLTSEAGLNDALAFPFIHLAILASTTALTADALGGWFVDKVVIKLAMGLFVGWLAGKALGWVIYHLPGGTRLSKTGDGFVALGATLAVYALTEVLHGYGFLAVFIAGLVLRQAANGHDFNHRLHDFADEAERLLMMALLVMFGAMLAGDEMFERLGWEEFAFAALMLFVIRPATGMIALIGVKRPMLEKEIIAFYGIRGLGSVYYVAYAANNGDFGDMEMVWNVLGLIILGSILLHGITVTPMMRRLDRAMKAKTGEREVA